MCCVGEVLVPLFQPGFIQKSLGGRSCPNFIRSENDGSFQRIIWVVAVDVAVQEGRKQGVAGSDRVDHRPGGHSRIATQEAVLADGQQRALRAQADHYDLQRVTREQLSGELLRGDRQRFMAQEKDIGGSHEIGVVFIVDPGERVHIAGHRHAQRPGSRQQRPRKVDVA